MPRAVFLDRDDTLIHCDDVTPDGDLGDPALVQLLPGVLEGCRRLKQAGMLLVVVSNQGGVARGRFKIEDVEAVNRRVDEALGGAIDAFRYCPYHPKGIVPEYAREHPWRKPQPGMYLDAAAALGIDVRASWCIGDRVRDCQAGRAAGCRTLLLPAPTYRKVPDDAGPGAESSIDHRAMSFEDAVGIVLSEARAPAAARATP